MRNPPDVAVFAVNESGRGSLKFYSCGRRGAERCAVATAAAAAGNPFQSFRMHSGVFRPASAPKLRTDGAAKESKRNRVAEPRTAEEQK